MDPRLREDDGFGANFAPGPYNSANAPGNPLFYPSAAISQQYASFET
jgi:hypothetical protein